jgi:quercetin dioxygenase-like cupin family protein
MANQEIIKTDQVLVRTMELAGGAATEWHYHSAVRDFFVCLKGVVTVESRNPDETVTLHPGQRTEIQPHRIHRVTNNQCETSEYLLVQGVGVYDFIKE